MSDALRLYFVQASVGLLRRHLADAGVGDALAVFNGADPTEVGSAFLGALGAAVPVTAPVQGSLIPPPAQKTRRSCPHCGKELVERTRRADGSKFIGCTGYPDCNYTENLDGTSRRRKGLFDAPVAPSWSGKDSGNPSEEDEDLPF